MENTANNNATATVNNTTAPATDNPEVVQHNQGNQRRREHGNFGPRKVVRDLADLDPRDFPAKPREERVPMWAQELAAQITLLSQEQQKFQERLDAIVSRKDDIHKEIFDNLGKIRENQKHVHDVLTEQHSFQNEGIETSIRFLKDIMVVMTKQYEEQHTKKSSNFFGIVFHPIKSFKTWWTKHKEARRVAKAQKLEAQLKALRESK
jgi:uncharacterized protein YeeX (DUF496 family)